MMDLVPFISRFYNMAEAYNVFNVRTVNIFFQKSPGWATDDKDKRGIQELDYEVFLNGTKVRGGKTKSDGKVEVQIRPGSTTMLRIAGTDYIVKQKTWYEDKNTTKGIQQRLRTLGYQLGDDLASNFGKIEKQTDRAILQFQADHGMAMMGTITPYLQDTLDTEAYKE